MEVYECTEHQNSLSALVLYHCHIRVLVPYSAACRPFVEQLGRRKSHQRQSDPWARGHPGGAGDGRKNEDGEHGRLGRRE